MEQSIIKRDNRIVSFDPSRIYKAIEKAFLATRKTCDPSLIDEICNRVSQRIHAQFFSNGKIPHVEEIQDLVESTLFDYGLFDVGKSYILYREKRNEVRNFKAVLINSISLIDDYLDTKDWKVNENSNMNYSLQGLNFYISSSVIARYWLNKLYPEKIRKAHISGMIHIHDLGVLGTYCVGWNLYDLLKWGFGGVGGKIESKPPKRLRTALGQIVNFFYTMQGEAAGAQALSNFDTLLAPFIRYNKLSYEDVKQCMQEFLFNINVPTRVGFQTPFTNITFDLQCPPTLEHTPVIIGGEEKEETYSEFQEEMNMINKAFCELMIEGDAKSRTFTFPIPTFNITSDFDYDNPQLEPLWEMTRKYGIPYFANFVNSDLEPHDVRSMCCRLRLDNRKLEKRGGGLFAASPLTGSIGVVTINLPRIAYVSSKKETFFTILSNVMEIAKESLEIKRKLIEKLTEQGLYPYSKYYLKTVKECSGKYWTNHFSTIGIIGMHEACVNLLGTPIMSKEGKEFAIEVLKFMRDKVSDFQEETGNLYNLEASPAEGTSYRLARIDKATYPDIFTSGTEEVPYYTNSVHLPVGYTNDIYEILTHQDDLQVLFTGGTVVHLFIGEEIPNADIIKRLVKVIVTNFKLPYFSITPTFSICPVHGYIPGKHEICPYPHTEEELIKYGIDFLVEEKDLYSLDKNAFIVIK